jgi:hypothetical protein
MKAPSWMPEDFRLAANAEHRQRCSDWYAKGALSVIEALRAGLEGETEPMDIILLIKFCDMIEARVKEPLAPAAEASR